MAPFEFHDDIDDICDAFESAWQSGHPPDVRDWVSRASPQTRERLRKELVSIDLEYRLVVEPKLDVAEYLRRHQLSTDDLLQTATVTLDGAALRKNTRQTQRWLNIPAQIGNYIIEEEIGRGGFGIVYRATDTILKRDVALKIPRDILTGELQTRFLREAEATAALDHPGLVPVFETGVADDICYIVTAFCPGQNLGDWLKDYGRISVRHAAEIVRDLATAMQHAHDRGIVHRDLKPSNIMAVARDAGEHSEHCPIAPRITDFGLAKILEEQREDTGSSVILGTPGYMAPEQISGTTKKSSYPAGDIYSLGVILFEMLAGRRPFERDTVVEVMDAIRNDDVPDLRKLQSDVPDDLATICHKCLSRDVGDRYVSCDELASDLARFLDGQPIAARPPGIRSRARHWLNKPARIQETGLLSILLGLGVPAWISLIILFVRIESLDAQIENEMIPQTLMITIVLLLPLAWVGYQTLRQRRFWIRTGFVLSIVNVLMVSPPLFGHVLVFADLYSRYPLGKIIAYTFLTLMFGLQVLQYGAALRSPIVKAGDKF